MPSANSNTSAEGQRPAAAARFGGPKSHEQPNAHVARPIPAAPPASASTTLSVSNCRMMRHRPPPMRRADRDFPPAGRRPRQQQVRHVDASDQQHEHDGRKHHIRGGAKVAEQNIAVQPNVHARPSMFLGWRSAMPRVTRSMSACAASRCHPRLQLGDHGERVRAVVLSLLRRKDQGRPELRREPRHVVLGRRNANDGMRFSVEANRSTNERLDLPRNDAATALTEHDQARVAQRRRRRRNTARAPAGSASHESSPA